MFTWLEDFSKDVSELAGKDDIKVEDADVILERFSRLRQDCPDNHSNNNQNVIIFSNVC